MLLPAGASPSVPDLLFNCFRCFPSQHFSPRALQALLLPQQHLDLLFNCFRCSPFSPQALQVLHLPQQQHQGPLCAQLHAAGVAVDAGGDVAEAGERSAWALICCCYWCCWEHSVLARLRHSCDAGLVLPPASPVPHCTLRSQRCTRHACCMQAYTDPLRGDVKAVGSSLVCLPEVDAGEPRCAEGFASQCDTMLICCRQRPQHAVLASKVSSLRLCCPPLALRRRLWAQARVLVSTPRAHSVLT